jgi:hypothetical protein
LKLNGTHQLLVYADGGKKCTYCKGKHRSLVMASKENGLEVNADKTKYMVVYRDQTAGRGHSMKTDNYQSSYCDIVPRADLETRPCT